MTTTVASAAIVSISRDTAIPSEHLHAPRRFSRRIASDLVRLTQAAAIVAVGAVLAAAYTATSGTPVDWLGHLQTCILTAAIAVVVLGGNRPYDIDRAKIVDVRVGAVLAALLTAFAVVPALGLGFLPAVGHFSTWYAEWFGFSFCALLLVHWGCNRILSVLAREGAFDVRVAVYGNGLIAQRLEKELEEGRLGITFAGLFDERGAADRQNPCGPSPSGDLDELVDKSRRGDVDRIIIALPQSADRRTQDIARRLEHLPVSLHVVTHVASDLVDAETAHNVSRLGTIGLLDVKPQPLADWSRVVKGLEDYVLAALLLIALLPLLALVAVVIKLDSSGPVLFRQRRRGLNNRIFDVLKFRTMTVLETDGDVMQAIPNDPRVTRVGRLLRWLSFDELPQLWNVLRGEMSLVGPRPHAVAHDDHFGDTVERYAYRQQVKPGITGLAQISGFRGGTETREKIERRTELDLEYVKTWSPLLDLKILALTLVYGWCDKNAY